MSPENLLDQKIKYFEQEILNLKTMHIKTATTIKTKVLDTSVNFSLFLPSELSTEILSTKRAIITMTAKDSTNMISACYLKNMTPSNLDSRFIFINRLSSSAGVVKYGITIYSENYNDYTTLAGGGSVNLTYDIEVVGSSDYNIDVVYKNIDGGV